MQRHRLPPSATHTCSPNEVYSAFPRLPCMLWTNPSAAVGEFMVMSHEFPTFFLNW